MPRSFLIKKAPGATNYSHCPLKKRPVHIVKETEPEMETEPENLSTKPEDLSLQASRQSSASPPATHSPPITPAPALSPLPAYYYSKPGVLEPLSLNLNTSLPETSAVLQCWPPVPTTTARQFPYPPQFPPIYARRPSPMYPPPALSPYAPRAASASPPARLYSAYTPSFPEDVQAPSLPPARGVTELLSPSSSSASSTTEVLGVEDLSRPAKRGGNGTRFQCPSCTKSYSSFSGLSKHRAHHCPASSGGSDAAAAAADQANNNAVVKSFSCKHCERTYVSLGALKMHIRTHTLPCKCTLCGKAFSRPWLLQGHIRTHTGEKPFSCQHCRRAFADRSNLRAHLQTHSDVKKYSCQHCSKTFSRMSLLGKHMDGGCPGLGLPAGASPSSPPLSPSQQQSPQMHPHAMVLH